MGPVLFQDDVARLAGDLESAQVGNDRMESVAETKLLDYNLQKSCYVVIGKKKERLEIEKKSKVKPLLLCEKPMNQEKSVKYLGDWISQEGLSESVSITVKNRLGLAKLAIFEMKTVVEDCRSYVVGELMTGITI